MKNQILGANSAPATRSKNEAQKDSLLGILLPDECRIKSRSDYFYVTSLFFLVAGFIFPPLVLGSAVCVALAKKGAKK